MAIDAKVSLISQAEKKLSEEVTADTMIKVMRIIADVIEGFSIVEIRQDDEQDDLLECYLDAMRVQGRSEKTLAQYQLVITTMMKAVKVKTRRITVYHLRQYLASLKERGVKDSTMEGYRQVFSAYFNWLQRESLIDKNPISNLGAIKCAKIQKQIFTDVDIEKMHRACKCLRDRAIIAFLAATGCRVSELTGLNRNSVDLEGLECVVRGKGNKERTVYMDGVTAMLVKNYLMQRKDDCIALFANRYGRRLNQDGVREMLTRIEKASGVVHIHPHKFRRTLATNLARKGMPIQEVAQILGHDKIDTTMQYVVLDKENTKQKYRQYA